MPCAVCVPCIRAFFSSLPTKCFSATCQIKSAFAYFIQRPFPPACKPTGWKRGSISLVPRTSLPCPCHPFHFHRCHGQACLVRASPLHGQATLVRATHVAPVGATDKLALSVLPFFTDKTSLSVPPIDEISPCSKLFALFCFPSFSIYKPPLIMNNDKCQIC